MSIKICRETYMGSLHSSWALTEISTTAQEQPVGLLTVARQLKYVQLAHHIRSLQDAYLG